MFPTMQKYGLDKLSNEEKIELVGEIWDSISNYDELFELTEEEKQELDRRLAEYEAHPETGMTWEEVRDQLRKRQKSSKH
ncbi:MAG: addiction module protein [Gemmatales bacterium]